MSGKKWSTADRQLFPRQIGRSKLNEWPLLRDEDEPLSDDKWRRLAGLLCGQNWLKRS
jgi:hypothetical protein